MLRHRPHSSSCRVDITHRRLLPRRHVAISVAATAVAVGFLSLAILSDILVPLTADAVFGWGWFWLAIPPGLWLFWSVVFYLFREQVSSRLDRTVGWLLNGSVLQLLVAVPTASGSVEIVRADEGPLVEDLRELAADLGMQPAWLSGTEGYGAFQIRCADQNIVDIRQSPVDDRRTRWSYELVRGAFARDDGYRRVEAAMHMRLEERAVPGTEIRNDLPAVLRWLLAWRPGNWIGEKCRLSPITSGPARG